MRCPLLPLTLHLSSDVPLIDRVDCNNVLGSYTIHTEFNILCNSVSGFINTQTIKNVPVCTEKQALQCLYNVFGPYSHCLG